jgi:hypothetical protein
MGDAGLVGRHDQPEAHPRNEPQAVHHMIKQPEILNSASIAGVMDKRPIPVQEDCTVTIQCFALQG